MNHQPSLILKLFGAPEIVLDGNQASGFDSDKVRALLVYLAVEADRPQRRERLAGLLWPDYPERSARTNLRRALSNLRQVIGDRDVNPPFLHITRQTIQFNVGSRSWLDVAAFSSLIHSEQEQIEQLQEAVDLYRGDFLEGFSLSDSAAFEEWTLLQRQDFLMQAMRALNRLAQQLETSGNYEQAIPYAQRHIDLDPYREEAQRQLMRLLALSGRAGDALAQYQTCKRILADELGSEPAIDTTALYERIKRSEFDRDGGRFSHQPVRGYELREFIGSGHFGAVYRAFQPAVGRDVAIKIILPQYADDPVFIRRFEAEAQIVARLEHPTIIPLYDYWREPGEAYLVMRWLRGGSLKASLVRGFWKTKPAMQLVDQIAAALATAHRQGVIHRDIKPANILLDDEGNAYLSDFGIATLTGPLAALSNSRSPGGEDMSGSLGYLSPETMSGEVVTTRTDIYSMGVVLYELLTAQHPFLDAPGQELIDKHFQEPLPNVTVLRPDLRPPIDDVIQKATAKDPRDRYVGPMELAVAFREALAPGVSSTAVSVIAGKISNPYKGLRSFQEADATEFFGREELIARLTASMDSAAGDESSRFVALVGPSGSGKSSIVKAGIIPALRRGAVPGSDNWFMVEMTPASHPLEELEAALLRIAVNPPESLLGQLWEDERGLLRAVKRVLPDEDGKLLLIIDQFEELFTLLKNEEERKRFLSGLTTALSQDDSPLRVIITLRADFYDRPLHYADFGELVRRNTEVILPLSPEELERAIVGPAAQVGVNLEPGLLADMIGGMTDQPGGLPLLQFALTELFDNRDGSTLTLEVYRGSGGVDGALSHRAETHFAALDDGEQEITRQLFLRLVTLGEGVEDTRRRVLRSELMGIQAVEKSDNELANEAEAVPRDILPTVLEAFGSSRLLTFDRDPETREPTVEIAHEALLSAWDRLRSWLRDGRDDIRLQRRLAIATAEWENAAQGESYLLRGARLALFEDWAGSSKVAHTRLEDIYLASSIAAREARHYAEEARRQAELETAQQLTETRTQANRRLRWLALGLAVILLVALGATILAWQQSQNSAQQARLATARELTAAALRNLDEDPELSILLALEAAASRQEVDQTILPETEEALHLAIQADRLQYAIGSKGALAYSPDGKSLAASHQHGFDFRDTVSNQHLGFLGTGWEEPMSLVFSADHRYMAATLSDGTILLLDATNGEEMLRVAAEGMNLLKAALSPDGSLLASSSEKGTVIVWDIQTGEKVVELPHVNKTVGIDFSPDGSQLAVSSFDKNAYLWDTTSWENVLTLSGHKDDVNDIDFDPGGTRLATASTDGTARFWDATTGEQLASMVHGASVLGADISPDGARLATGGIDGRAIVWEIETGRQLIILPGHPGNIDNVGFSPDGKHLATGSPIFNHIFEGLAGHVRVWDISPSGSRDWSTLAGHDETVIAVAYSPDGTRLASGSRDGTVKLWKVTTGEELATMTGHTDQVARIAFTPDSSRLATASYDGTVKMWDVASGETLFTIQPAIGIIRGLAISPDGRRLVIGGEDGSLIYWDATSGAELSRLAGHPASIWRLNYSPDGELLASAGSDNTARLWDTATNQELFTLRGHRDGVNQAVFNQDGSWLATTSMDGTIKIWDSQTGRLQKTFVGHTDAVWDVEINPAGTRMASVGFDGTIRLWDVETRETMLTFPSDPAVPDLAISPDGKFLAIGAEDTTIRTFVLPVEDLIDLATTRVSRSLTNQECRRYLHLDQCPEAVRFLYPR